MNYVKLIETVRQIKNHVEVVATIKDQTDREFLAISDFFLMTSENLPHDEDDLCNYLEKKQLDWDLYIPVWEDDVLVSA